MNSPVRLHVAALVLGFIIFGGLTLTRDQVPAVTAIYAEMFAHFPVQSL